MKAGDVVKSNMPFRKQYSHGIILSIKPLAGNKESANVYWDDNRISDVMTIYLEAVCK